MVQNPDQLQEIAQKLIDDLRKELESAEENVKIIKGAVQGVQLLYGKLIEPQQQEQANVQDIKAANKKPSKKASK